MGNRRHSEGDRIAALEAAGLLTLAPQEGERQIESFDLASPVLFDGSFAAGEEVLLQLIETGQSD